MLSFLCETEENQVCFPDLKGTGNHLYSWWWDHSDTLFCLNPKSDEDSKHIPTNQWRNPKTSTNLRSEQATRESIWRFPEMGVPPNHPNFFLGFSTGPTIHYFRKPPWTSWGCHRKISHHEDRGLQQQARRCGDWATTTHWCPPGCWGLLGWSFMVDWIIPPVPIWMGESMVSGEDVPEKRKTIHWNRNL